MFLINKKLSRSQKGDTIIEVLLAITILAVVIASAYVISSRAMSTTRQNNERNQAIRYAETQLEYLKDASVNSSDFDTVVKNELSGNENKCFSSTGNGGYNINSGNGCRLDDRYEAYVKYYNPTTNIGDEYFVATILWEGERGPQRVDIPYRAYYVDFSTLRSTATSNSSIRVTQPTLNTYQSTISSVNQSLYTPISWATYLAIVNANQVNSQSTEQQVLDATQIILNAQNALVLAAPPPTPTLVGIAPGQYRITNYNSRFTYNLSQTSGTSSRSGDIVSCTGTTATCSIFATSGALSSSANNYQRTPYTYSWGVTGSYVIGSYYTNWPSCPGGYNLENYGWTYACTQYGNTYGNIKNPTPAGWQDSGSDWYRIFESPPPTAPTLVGVAPGQYRITNYFSSYTYNLSQTAGTSTRSGDTVTCTGTTATCSISATSGTFTGPTSNYQRTPYTYYLRLDFAVSYWALLDGIHGNYGFDGPGSARSCTYYPGSNQSGCSYGTTYWVNVRNNTPAGWQDSGSDWYRIY